MSGEPSVTSILSIHFTALTSSLRQSHAVESYVHQSPSRRSSEAWEPLYSGQSDHGALLSCPALLEGFLPQLVRRLNTVYGLVPSFNYFLNSSSPHKDICLLGQVAIVVNAAVARSFLPRNS